MLQQSDVVPKTESLVWQALQALCGILIELFYPHSLQSNGGDVILAIIIALHLKINDVLPVPRRETLVPSLDC